MSVAAGALFREYGDWAKAEGIREKEQLSLTAFGRRMGERFAKRTTREGKSYDGIALLSKAQSGFSDAAEDGGVTGSEGEFESTVTGWGSDPTKSPIEPRVEDYADNPSHPSHPSQASSGEPCQECGSTCETYYDDEGNLWCAQHGPGVK